MPSRRHGPHGPDAHCRIANARTSSACEGANNRLRGCVLSGGPSRFVEVGRSLLVLPGPRAAQAVDSQKLSNAAGGARVACRAQRPRPRSRGVAQDQPRDARSVAVAVARIAGLALDGPAGRHRHGDVIAVGRVEITRCRERHDRRVRVLDRDREIDLELVAVAPPAVLRQPVDDRRRRRVRRILIDGRVPRLRRLEEPAGGRPAARRRRRGRPPEPVVVEPPSPPVLPPPSPQAANVKTPTTIAPETARAPSMRAMVARPGRGSPAPRYLSLSLRYLIRCGSSAAAPMRRFRSASYAW